LEASCFYGLSPLVGGLRICWDFVSLLVTVLDRFATDKSPDIVEKGAEILLHLHKPFSILDGSFDLHLIPNNAGILHQFLNSTFGKLCHDLIVKISESPPVSFPLFEYGGPT